MKGTHQCAPSEKGRRKNHGSSARHFHDPRDGNDDSGGNEKDAPKDNSSVVNLIDLAPPPITLKPDLFYV